MRNIKAHLNGEDEALEWEAGDGEEARGNEELAFDRKTC